MKSLNVVNGPIYYWMGIKCTRALDKLGTRSEFCSSGLTFSFIFDFSTVMTFLSWPPHCDLTNSTQLKVSLVHELLESAVDCQSSANRRVLTPCLYVVPRFIITWCYTYKDIKVFFGLAFMEIHPTESLPVYLISLSFPFPLLLLRAQRLYLPLREDISFIIPSVVAPKVSSQAAAWLIQHISGKK